MPKVVSLAFSLLIGFQVFFFLPSFAWAHNQAFVIGVTGGSASGKTTIAKALAQLLKEDPGHEDMRPVCLMSQDDYIADSEQPEEYHIKEGPLKGFPNFDHPTAVSLPLIAQHLLILKKGGTVQVPVFDWSVKKRSDKTIPMGPCSIIILEGIHAFHDPNIRGLMNQKIFVELDDAIRLKRRLDRDEIERGRDRVQNTLIYEYMARPIYQQLIEQNKNYADFIIDTSGTKESVSAGVVGVAEKIRGKVIVFKILQNILTKVRASL